MASPPPGTVLEALRRSAILGALPQDTLERVARGARSRACRAGQLVFRRGDDGGSLFVLLTGRVKITVVSPSGAEVILNVIEPGEIFGEMSLLDGEPRCADAVAAAACDLVELDRRALLPVLESDPAISREMMRILCRRIRQASSFAESAVLLSAPARLFLRIRALADQHGAPQADGTLRVEHGFSQQEIADSVGITRVSVNTHLAEWRRAGLIDYGRRVIEIRDLDALAVRALGAAAADRARSLARAPA